MKNKVAILVIGLVFSVFSVFSIDSARAQSSLAEMLPKVNPGVKRVPQMIMDSKMIGANYGQRELFARNTARLVGDGKALSEAVTDAVLLNLDKAAIKRILEEKPQYLTLPVPDGKGGVIELEIAQVNIFAAGFKVETSAPTSENFEKGLGLHYRGMIKGEPISLVAVSVFENEIMGSIRSKKLGNAVIGRLTGDNPGGTHIFYDERKLKASPENFCNVRDSRIPERSLQINEAPTEENNAVAVRFIRKYLELNYDVFQNKGSVAATLAFTTGFFNQAAALFANDGIFVSLQGTFVWNTPSPYTFNDSFTELDTFKATRTTFNGNLAHLITLKPYGGLAWVDTYCDNPNRYALSGVNPDFENVPTYSWTVGVFVHETGHNLGSPHTHSCSWNGNMTAIDSCQTVEGGCASPGFPAGGGTIMSYCHLQQNIGINFMNGFGPQPKALIQGKIAAAPCLTDSSRAPFDFDGDGKTDIGIYRTAAGEWWIQRSSNNATFAAQFGAATDRIVPGDYTGDGKADIAIFRPASGEWFVLRSNDSSFYSFPFGIATDKTVPADYDGDGKTDAAVYRPSTATWYINKSTGGTTIATFGAATDLPVPADYDGDGKADIAIYRPNGANGAEWWVQRSSNGSVFAATFGNASDKAVPGDYTGDGKADIAIFRPSNGNWFVLRSNDFSFYSFPFGTNGDQPAPGDYDGDGKFDAAVFRPSSNTWFVNRSTAGTLIQQYGAAGDSAIPTAYVP